MTDPWHSFFPKEIERSEDELDYAYVRDLRTEHLRTTFIRLVRPGQVKDPAKNIDTISAEDCQVDVDEEGNIVGLTVSFFRED